MKLKDMMKMFQKIIDINPERADDTVKIFDPDTDQFEPLTCATYGTGEIELYSDPLD